MDLIKTSGVIMNYYSYKRKEYVAPIRNKETPMSVMDLTICVDGEMYYWYNGEYITLHPGDGILIVPGSHRERFETNAPGALYASINLIFDYPESFEINGYLPNILNSDILFMLELLKKEYPVVSPKRNEKCLAIFEYIYKCICETVCNNENPHVRTIKQYISDNITEDISLDTLSQHVHLAPQYICTLFKKETGMTITHFILKERIEHAKLAMVACDDPISKIAEFCGFNDYCYFSHAFKKITGVSANQYRKIKRQ